MVSSILEHTTTNFRGFIMRNTYQYLYNIGGKDIVKHLAYLDLDTIEKRSYNDGKQVLKPRKQSHQLKTLWGV